VAKFLITAFNIPGKGSNMEDTSNLPKLLNQNEVSKIIRKSPAWLERKRWEGGGIPFRKLGRHVLYEQADVQCWIESQPKVTSTSEIEGTSDAEGRNE
jgi:hypothetical protein